MSDRPRLPSQMPQEILTIRKSSETFETWIRRPYISNELGEELAQANVLVVPTEGFRDGIDFSFPSGTEQLMDHLCDCRSEGMVVDVCVEDADYRELALHADVVMVAGIVATAILAPIVVSLVSEYIKRRIWRAESDVTVWSELTVVEEGCDRSVHLSYHGPARAYGEIVSKAIDQLGSQTKEELTPPEHPQMDNKS